FDDDPPAAVVAGLARVVVGVCRPCYCEVTDMPIGTGYCVPARRIGGPLRFRLSLPQSIYTILVLPARQARLAFSRPRPVITVPFPIARTHANTLKKGQNPPPESILACFLVMLTSY
ncbi:MAG: hypothetical protein Q7U92_06985, partial [Bradyrhizobium sp.]|nr:hypothetical protein [Bradyrhizobium sp.]